MPITEVVKSPQWSVAQRIRFMAQKGQIFPGLEVLHSLDDLLKFCKIV